MPTELIVPLVIGLIIVLSACACAVKAPRLPMPIRIVSVVVLIPVGLFCAFGFAAASEPGDYHHVWQIGYAIVFLACVSAIGRLALAGKAKKPKS